MEKSHAAGDWEQKSVYSVEEENAKNSVQGMRGFGMSALVGSGGGCRKRMVLRIRT